MSAHEEIIKRLEKAKLYLAQTAKICKDTNNNHLISEADSLIRLLGLLQMNIDSIKRDYEYTLRMTEHDKRIAELSKDMNELSKSINEGEQRIQTLLGEAKQMHKLDPASPNFREQLAQIQFNDSTIAEAVKAFVNGDDEKAFKELEAIFNKPKH